jgi:hypothetical protein
MTEYEGLPFDTVAIGTGDLQIPHAKSFVVSLESLPFVKYLSSLRVEEPSTQEVIIFEVEIERPQRFKFPVKRLERLAVIFTSDGDTIPDVLALRTDFPQVPHLNLRTYERPKSLCLYDGDPRDVMLRWTPLLFIERIRQWLSLTAKGELHQEDQPLEPLLLQSFGAIVLPDRAYCDLISAKDIPVLVYRVSEEKDHDWMLIAKQLDTESKQKKPPFVAMGFLCDQTTHGIIRKQPNTVSELASLVEINGMDLIGQLRIRLLEWYKPGQIEYYAESFPILVISIPKARIDKGEVEEIEVWAFACDKKLVDLGVDLGIWSVADGEIGLHMPADETKCGNSVPILPLKTIRSFSRKSAALLSGLLAPSTSNIVQIGVGALGSHFFLNAIRAGLGQWTVVDNDRLLPHNLARHVLEGRAVGLYKAQCMSFLANEMIDDNKPVSTPIITDVLSPREQDGKLKTALSEADVIVDASASLSVERYLALDVDSPARRVSTFFTPSGNSSVFLMEDKERHSPIDILEMQYYREILRSDQLKDHLNISGRPIRYGQSCRDLTSRIPQDFVMIHAALAIGAFKKTLDQPTAFGGIWTIESDTQQISFIPIPTSSLVQLGYQGWRIRTDQTFISKLSSFRKDKLPNETGGIILGTHDMKRRIVYLIDTIPSPPDSEEWPTVYIRGCKGLAERVRCTETKTAGNVSYVGEWHSHPDGASVRPSQDDMKAFCWLRSHMSSAGLPPLMMIIGGGERIAVYIEEMR